MVWCCITAHLYEEQISISVTAVAQACCQPGLQSSTEQWGSYLALTRPAVHCYCINVHLFEKQISMGVIAVAQASCQLGLQSSTEQWGSYLALTSAAGLWCCITAHLYEEQIPKVYLQWHKHAVSLVCRAALNSGEAILL